MKSPSPGKRVIILEAVLVLLAGTALFTIKFGWFLVDPFQYEWMLIRGSDVSTDFLVWMFYLQTPWTFPVGMVEGYAYPFPLSVISTSALALFAIPAKGLATLLDTGVFQYFGLWILLSCLLQGLFGWMVLRAAGVRNPVLLLLGTVFFLLSPCWLDRRFHISLFGHWIILLGVWMYLARPRGNPIHPLGWWLHAALSVLSHPYFIVFSLGLALASGWKQYPGRRFQRVSVLLAGQLALIAGLLFAGGHFHSVQGEGRIFGFGYYSANLNTFFNPLGKTALPASLPVATPGQYEGFAYLGLGGWMLFLGGLGALMAYPDLRNRLAEQVRKNLPLLIIAIGFLLYALSNQVSFFSAFVIIPLPEKWLDLLSIFRSSGRFIWLPYYLLLPAMIWLIDRAGRRLKPLAWLFFLPVLWQAWDVRPQLVRDYQPDGYSAPPFRTDLMTAAMEGADQIITFPPYTRTLVHPNDDVDLMLLAGRLGKPITMGYFARFDQVRDKPFSDSLHLAVRLKAFDHFPKALWIIAPEELYRFRPSPETDHPLQLLFHKDYGLGFGPDLAVPDLLLESPEVDTQFLEVMHVADWLGQQEAAYLLVSVKDEALNGMDEKLKAYFSELGSEAIHDLCYRCGWAAVFGPEGLLVEDVADQEGLARVELTLSDTARTLSVELESSGILAGNKGAVLLDGKDHSPQKRGLNVVLLGQDLQPVGSWGLDTHERSYLRLNDVGEPVPDR